MAIRFATLALLCWCAAPAIAQTSDTSIDFPTDPLASPFRPSWHDHIPLNELVCDWQPRAGK